MTGFEKVVSLKHVLVIPYSEDYELPYIQDIFNCYFADLGLPAIRRWELLGGKYLKEHFDNNIDDTFKYLGICVPKSVSMSVINLILNDGNLGGGVRLLTNP